MPLGTVALYCLFCPVSRICRVLPAGLRRSSLRRKCLYCKEYLGVKESLDASYSLSSYIASGVARVMAPQERENPLQKFVENGQNKEHLWQKNEKPREKGTCLGGQAFKAYGKLLLFVYGKENDSTLGTQKNTTGDVLIALSESDDTDV